jgi:hypothetical protein
VHEQLHQAAWNTSLNDSLNLVVGAVRKVGNGPARIDKDLVVERVYEFGKNRECGLDLLFT